MSKRTALKTGDDQDAVTRDRDWLTMNPQVPQRDESEMVTARLRQAVGG